MGVSVGDLGWVGCGVWVVCVVVWFLCGWVMFVFLGLGGGCCCFGFCVCLVFWFVGWLFGCWVWGFFCLCGFWCLGWVFVFIGVCVLCLCFGVFFVII